jgi:dCTP deaminase
MISPFLKEKVVWRGKSYGLSSCSYDARIAEDTVLGPNFGAMKWYEWGFHSLRRLIQPHKYRPCYALASTIEHFRIPNNVCGFVCDKSTYARLGVSAFNTLFDPGFTGFGTLELVNHGPKEVRIKSGDPICQFVFYWLDRPTDRPYQGKYQNQAAGPQPAIHEE